MHAPYPCVCAIHAFLLRLQRNWTKNEFTPLPPSSLCCISEYWRRHHVRVCASGDNLLKNRPRASTSEYKQLPINWRLFENTVKLPDKLLQRSRNLKFKNRYPIFYFKCIQVHSKQGNFRKEETIILSQNMSLNTIVSTDICVALGQEICLPIVSDYSQFFWACRASTINDMPNNWQLSRERVSPLVITSSLHDAFLS